MDFIDIDGSAATDVELANDALSSAGVFGTKNLFAGFVLSDDGVSFWDGAWTDDDSPTPAFGNGYLFDLLTSIEILGVNAGGEGAAAVATNDAQGFFRLVDIYIAGKTASDELAGFVYRNNGDFVGEISGRNVSVFADNGTSAYGVYFRDTLRSGGVAADWWADITDSVVFNDIIAIGENEAVGFLAATIQDGASVTLNSVTASSRGEADDVDASWAMGVQLDGIANGGTLTVTDLIDVTGTDAATYGLFVRDTFDGDGVVGGIMAKSVDGIAEGVRVGRGLGVPVNLDGTLDVGIIAVNAVGEAYGIHVIGEVGGKIDVSSTITAISANDSAYGIRIHDGVMAGAEIDVLGKITATGGGAGGAAGFAVHDGTTAGTINLNAVETSGTWAVGVHSLGELEGDLTINGLLKATATEWDAIGLMVGHLSTFEDITGSVTVDEIAVSATAVGSIAAGDLGANAFGIRAGNIDDLTLKGNITVDGTGGETSGIQALGYANITLDGNVTMRATWTGDEDWDGGNAKWVGAAIWTDGNLTVNLNTKMLDVVGGVKADGGNVTFNGAGTANLDKVTAGNNFANNGNIVNVSGNMDVVGTLTNSGTLKVDGTLTYGTLNNTGGLLIETTKGPNGTWTYGGGANMPDPLSGAVNAGVFDSYGDTIGVFVNGATGTFNVKGDTIITTAFADYGSTNVDAGKTLSFTFAGTALINELGGAGNVAGGIGTDITVMGTDSLGFTGNIQTNGTGNMDIHNGAYSGILDAANDLNIVTGVFNGTMRAGNDVNIAGDAGVFNGDVVAGNSVNIQNGQYNGNITAQGNSVNIAAGEFGGAVFGAMDVNVAGGAFNANGAIAAGNNVNIQNGQFDGIIQALGNDVNIAAGEFGAAIVAANDVNVAGGAFNAGAVIVGDNNVNIYNGQFDGTITARGNDVNIVTGEFGGAIFGAMDVNVAGGAFNANGAIAAGNNVNIQNGQFDGII
ncbi:MAG: hypothetical protein FWE95_06405, partial [Planctomycetaceae bacterium]|nr:hypothetical protein [Planctomycetaceae bacterium]